MKERRVCEFQTDLPVDVMLHRSRFAAEVPAATSGRSTAHASRSVTLSAEARSGKSSKRRCGRPEAAVCARRHRRRRPEFPVATATRSRSSSWWLSSCCSVRDGHLSKSHFVTPSQNVVTFSLRLFRRVAAPRISQGNRPDEIDWPSPERGASDW